LVLVVVAMPAATVSELGMPFFERDIDRRSSAGSGSLATRRVAALATRRDDKLFIRSTGEYGNPHDAIEVKGG
jgi:hypothetical protein